jgi:hypothetical protein
VLIPVSIAASEPLPWEQVVAACRNEQAEADVHKFRTSSCRTASGTSCGPPSSTTRALLGIFGKVGVTSRDELAHHLALQFP